MCCVNQHGLGLNQTNYIYSTSQQMSAILKDKNKRTTYIPAACLWSLASRSILNVSSGASMRSKLGHTDAPGQRLARALAGVALGGGVRGEEEVFGRKGVAVETRDVEDHQDSSEHSMVV